MNRILLLGLFVLVGWALYGNATAPVVVTDDLPFATLSTQSPADPNLAQSLNTPAAPDATSVGNEFQSTYKCYSDRFGKTKDVDCGTMINQIAKSLDSSCNKVNQVALAECTVIYESSGYVYAQPRKKDGTLASSARGLMQLISSTAARFGVSDPFDAYQNILGGMKYHKFLLKEFNCNVDKAILGYYNGEGNVAAGKSFAGSDDYLKKIKSCYVARMGKA